MGVVRGNETPFVFADVIDFTTHVVITSYNINFVLEKETLVRDAKLIHGVQVLPGLGCCVEQMDFTISVRILSSYQDYLIRRDRQGTASPKRIFHPDRENLPDILLHIKHFNAVVDLLLSAAEEATKCVNELIIYCACAEVVALVFHGWHLRPLVFSHLIFFH